MFESEELWRAKSGRPAPAAGSFVGWLLRVALILAVAVGGGAWLLSMRGEIAEAAREIAPEERGEPAPAGDAEDAAWSEGAVDRELVLRKSPNGHFLVSAYVNGVETRFLVDTGASDVALTAEDAERIGLNTRGLHYTRAYQTANGVIRAAPVTLRDVRIAQLRVRDVQATITEAPMGISLLGMSFLGELAGYEVRGDRLILRW